MTAPLRIVIVDDETPARNRLRDLLHDCAGQIPLQVVGEAENGVQALQLLAQTAADVVLLDIHMPGLDGMAVAQQLAQRQYPAAVIFTTAYDAHALQAFELNARDYLLKPVRVERLLGALRKVQPSMLKPAPVRQYLSTNERGRVLLVPVDDIICLRAEQKYVAARTATHTYLLEDTLTSLEQEFPQRFIRIHRNTLVARNAIAGFALKEQSTEDGEHSGWVVLLKDSDEALPVSRRQYAVVKQFKQGGI
ncbi:MAG: LytTR family DNA-binding domain-containing protein [Sulfuriferula sp.]|nr:LytTR family DNA-binding domain-containing protein [Sulfuriferula sp.]